MSFTFQNSDGGEIRQIYSCQRCGYISTKRHFREGQNCPLCRGESEEVGTQAEKTGMPAYRYQQILSRLEEETSGVGPSTIESIRAEFEDGDELLSAAESAYKSGEWSGLTDLDGIGQTTAERIVSEIADIEGWDGGVTDGEFSFSV